MSTEVGAFQSTMLVPARPQAASGRSVLQNLADTNEEMLLQIGRDVSSFVQHPLKTLGAAASGMVFPLIHPIRAVRDWATQISENPLEGTVSVASTATGLAFVGSVFIAALATVAAPFTGGASLAIAAAAMTVGNVAAYACIGTTVAGIAYHEIQGATADSEEEAREQGRQAAIYVEDGALLAAGWVAGDAFQARFFSKTAQGTARGAVGWIGNNTIGLAGVYDAPVAAAPRIVPHGGAGVPDGLAVSAVARQGLLARPRGPAELVRELKAEP